MGAETSSPRFNAGEFAGTYQGCLSNKYEILKQLGAGAQGAAYLVRMKDGGGEYVAKETHNMTPQGKAEFKQEFEKMRDMRHPNCAKIIEMVEGKDFIDGEWKDQIFVISELARGSDLYKYVRKAGQTQVELTEEWVACVYRQAMEGVAYIHSRGIVHNDLKPDNILCLEDFNPADPCKVPAVVINDFGCATLASDSAFKCGDLRYQSPESWRVIQHLMEGGDLVGTRKLEDKADVWSMGATLFELLSGGLIAFVYRPCTMEDISNEEGLLATLRDNILQEPIQIRPHCMGLSEEGADLLQKIFCKDPSARPSAAEVLKHPWFDIKGRPMDPSIQWKLEFKTTKCLAHTILLNAVSSKVQRDHYMDCFDAFREADGDKSGVIELAEFTRACEKMGRQDAEALFHQADIDGDGAVDFNEFMAVTFQWDKLDSAVLKQSVRRLFDDLDKNGNGEVDEKELSSLFQGILDTESFQSVFQRMDLDRDGRISIREMEHFLFEPTTEEDLQSFVNERHRSSVAQGGRGSVTVKQENKEAEWLFSYCLPATVCICLCWSGLGKIM